jgi:acetylornithine deacetylase/succinyl-diaminopimelate desuccinylase-like protein
VTPDALLDRILVPRPNGSEAIEQVAAFLAEALETNGAQVAFHEFASTPHGFQLAWTAALLLMLAYLAAVAARRHGLALLLPLVTAGLLLLEFELMRSPVSGLLPATQRNVVATYPGAGNGALLVFCAHYDTTTHFGDHFSWGAWGRRQGPAVALAVAVAVAGLWWRRRGREIPRLVTLPAAGLAVVPFAAMFWLQAVGPLVRAPSPGAVDNGGSVAALLLLSQRLAERPEQAPTAVRLVFLAAEEERTLGSWAYARTLAPESPVAVVNLESIGADETLAYIPEDGWALRRYRSPDWLVAFVNAAARRLFGRELPPRELPFGTLTDGRSFLARGIPALTLRAFTGDEFPRRLHSAHDSRDRLSTAAIERGADLLYALVEAADADPSRIGRLRRQTAGSSRGQ